MSYLDKQYCKKKYTLSISTKVCSSQKAVVEHSFKIHVDEKGNLLLPLYEPLFQISSEESFICTISQTK